jgi:hypothetical protein
MAVTDINTDAAASAAQDHFMLSLPSMQPLFEPLLEKV